jgi:hypothetical protein
MVRSAQQSPILVEPEQYLLVDKTSSKQSHRRVPKRVALRI